MNDFFKKLSIWKVILIYFWLQIITGFSFGLTFYLTWNIQLLDSDLIWNLMSSFSDLVIILIFFSWFEKYNFDWKKYISKIEFKPLFKESLFVVFFSALFSIWISSVIPFIISKYYPAQALDFANSDLLWLTSIKTWYELVIMWILAVIFAPIIEEFIFRWVLTSRLSIKYSYWTSVIISSFLFWIVHWLTSFIWAFITWILLFIIYKKNENIFASMFTHILNNLSAFLFLTVLFFFFPEEISSKITLEDLNSWIYYFLPITIIWFSWIIYYLKKNEKYLKN